MRQQRGGVPIGQLTVLLQEVISEHLKQTWMGENVNNKVSTNPEHRNVISSKNFKLFFYNVSFKKNRMEFYVISSFQELNQVQGKKFR